MRLTHVVLPALALSAMGGNLPFAEDAATAQVRTDSGGFMRGSNN